MITTNNIRYWDIMDFDPLSLFTPCHAKENDILQIEFNSIESSSLDTQSSAELGETIDDSKNFKQPIHIHDLPLLQLRPPGEVILVFLKLFSPNEVFNFTSSKQEIASEDKEEEEEVIFEKVFEDKGVTKDEIKVALPWLKRNNPRFSTETALAYITLLGTSLKKTYERDYNSWLTRLISSDLLWVSDSIKTDIIKQTSLRISENCGRTAQPEIIRTIGIRNLDKLKLKEPSLTGDNLGMKTWGSALILGNRLVQSTTKDYLVSPVLELGSGTGLVGMICCILGYETIMTDLKEIIPNLQDNVDLNSLKDKLKIHELDWSDPSSFIKEYGDAKYKTIILSDPIYSSMHPYWVINMINKFLDVEDNRSRILLQIPIRRSFEKERELLWDLINENGFQVVEEEIEKGYDDFGENEFMFKKIIKE